MVCYALCGRKRLATVSVILQVPLPELQPISFSLCSSGHQKHTYLCFFQDLIRISYSRLSDNLMPQVSSGALLRVYKTIYAVDLL